MRDEGVEDVERIEGGYHGLKELRMLKGLMRDEGAEDVERFEGG